MFYRRPKSMRLRRTSYCLSACWGVHDHQKQLQELLRPWQWTDEEPQRRNMPRTTCLARLCHRDRAGVLESD